MEAFNIGLAGQTKGLQGTDSCGLYSARTLQEQEKSVPSTESQGNFRLAQGVHSRFGIVTLFGLEEVVSFPRTACHTRAKNELPEFHPNPARIQSPN